ncbi:hypothetical protein ACIBI4_09345 [Streptomyces sp. NPDC050418]|uniref:hypothetical protein n=1 Tax=Streptomyces sp. NPDC050418 TaxID=3365612 RepID=UPI0037908F31
MLTVQILSESGVIQVRARHGVEWSPELGGLDQSAFPMFGHLLPYADTMFNSRQVATLLNEIPRLPPSVLTDECAQELTGLALTVLDGQGLYLWFFGD